MNFRINDTTVIHIETHKTQDNDYLDLITDCDLRHTEDAKTLVDFLNRFIVTRNPNRRIKLDENKD